jgi:patatin-like phospholipase/acyl hydrolase
MYHTPVYPNKEKTELIETYVGVNTPFITENSKDVFITTYNMSKQKPEFFKSWEKNNYLTKDIINASSAVPGLYPPILIGKDYYIDGGVSTNNPTECVYSDIRKKYGNDTIIKILSIGCGRKKQFKINSSITEWGNIKWIMSGNIGLFIGNEQVVDANTKNFTELLGDIYMRIDGEMDKLYFTDTSKEYRSIMNDTADLWYEENRDILIKFFK